MRVVRMTHLCSSDFITDEWLEILRKGYAAESDIDWRNQALSQFRLLSSFCQFSNQTMYDARRRFLVESFVTSNALTENDFKTQINVILDEFSRSTTVYFDLLVKTTRLWMQVDQPYMGLIHQGSALPESDLFLTASINNETDDMKTIQIKFTMSGTRDINTTNINCICATNPHCRSPATIFDSGLSYNDTSIVRPGYVVPGFSTGCSSLESLRLSTLECLYSTSHCFSILTEYIRIPGINYNENPFWSHFRLLIYNSQLSQFPPDISISFIISKLMTERWDSTISYEQFYQSCAPNHCSYSDRIHTKTGFEIIITLISMISGVRILFRLLIPILIKFIIRLFTKNRQRQQVRMKLYDRLKLIVQKLKKLMSTIVINLNFFPSRHFGNNVNQATAKRLSQWTTRLYIFLLIIIVIILALYSIAQPQVMTKIFNKPSLNIYNHLKQEYKDTLKCSCTSIASTYNQFVNITAKFHQICTSHFVSDEWRNNLIVGHVANLSIYTERDYRRFLSAHLQFLQGLCYLSIQSVNSSINQFLSSLFITAQLLSFEDFNIRLELVINETKTNAPIIFNRLLSLIRIVNDGNAFLTRYGTNFNYILKLNDFYYTYAWTRAVIYDKNCSCGLLSNCTTQAYFIESNSTDEVKGLRIGCTPSESFLQSTLECFYDQLCLNLIQKYTNYTQTIIPLNQTTRFLMNITINEMIKNVFVDDWEIFMSYSSYFNKCSPSMCSYTYVKQFNLFNTITFLLSVQGGLIIILKWICPHIIRVLFTIYQYRKKRNVVVHTISSIEITSIENANDNIPSRIPPMKSQSTTNELIEVTAVPPIRFITCKY
ncbi:hypothetical protein I4U23_025701 [Adineta vaga]|nr:hypothetical protein I4U23_025701 [Adineta vaga]